MISLRSMEEDDIRAIADFFADKKELHYSFPRIDFPIKHDQMKAVIMARASQTVLLNDGVPAGFADIYNLKEREECFLGNFIIHRNHRRKGLAAMLLKEMIAIASREHHVKNINLYCWCENTAGLLLYHRFGFIPVALEIRDFEEGKVPVIRMELTVK